MSFETVTLDSLCELVVDCPHSTPKWTDEGIIVLRNQNIKNGVLDLSAPSFTNEEDYLKRIKRAAPKAGDIVFTREAPMGEVCMIPEGVKCCLGQRQVLLRPKSDVNGQYLFWALQSPYVQQQIAWNEGTGSTVSNVRIPVLKALNIPRIDNEDMVAKSLSDIASKMALNTQTNQTLEQTAQAIFKSWFVDFDPVKAKMNGKQPEGMDEATASLFPEKLVESELGLIPEGWELKTLKSLSEKISKGTTPSKMDLESATDEPFIRFIKVRDINEQGEILRSKLENIPDSIHTTKLKRSILKKEDILFSIAGTIGRVAIVDQDLDNVNTNQAVAFVRLKEKQTYLPLVYMALRENRLQQKAIASIVQGVQANLSLANVGDMEVIVPSEDILNLWNKQYSSILQMIKNNFAQSRELASLRDTLLPKLLSGEIDLAETTIK